jgi:hypothetical protein
VAGGDIRLPGRTNGGQAAVRTAIVLLMRDVRVTTTALSTAAREADRTVPLFVLDHAI